MSDLKQLELQYVTNQAGERTAIILPLEQLQELIEDIEDLAAIAERRHESTISQEELITELKQDGLA